MREIAHEHIANISVRRAVRGVMAAHRLQDGGAAHATHGPSDKEKLREEVALRKAEAEKVCRSRPPIPVKFADDLQENVEDVLVEA